MREITGQWEEAFRVDSRCADLFDRCRASAVLGFMQEAAAGHIWGSEHTWDVLYRKYGVHWVLVRQWYELTRPVLRGETLLLRTWMRKPTAAASYRDFDIFSGEEQVGQAVAQWAMIDAKTRRLVRLDTMPPLRDAACGENPKDITFGPVKLPDSLEDAGERRVYFSDCDHNHHMNNLRYADFACDALGCETRGGTWVSSAFFHYRAECRLGDTLSLYACNALQDAWVTGKTQAGQHCFTARLRFAGEA